LEITINAKQIVLAIWTLIAIAISLIIVLGIGLVNPPWWVLVAAFFGVVLVITLPVYLLVAAWGMVSKSESE